MKAKYKTKVKESLKRCGFFLWSNFYSFIKVYPTHKMWKKCGVNLTM